MRPSALRLELGGYALGASGLGIVVALALSERGIAREIALARGSGWLALAFFFAALAVTPILGLASRRWPRATLLTSPLRRALGVTSAALAAAHAALAHFGFLRGRTSDLLTVPWVRGGLVALAILALLWATSYRWPRRVIGLGDFRPLHALAYVAPLFLLQHLLLGPFAPRLWVLALFTALSALFLLRALPRPKRAAAPDEE